MCKALIAAVFSMVFAVNADAAEQGGTIVLTSPVPEIVEEIADRIIVLKNGEIAAFDTLASLREMTGCDGSLTDILELLMFPETTQKLQDYFKELPK